MIENKPQPVGRILVRNKPDTTCSNDRPLAAHCVPKASLAAIFPLVFVMENHPCDQHRSFLRLLCHFEGGHRKWQQPSEGRVEPLACNNFAFGSPLFKKENTKDKNKS